MEMSEKLDRLKNLQEILAKKYEIEAKVDELPKSLDGKTALLERVRKEYIQVNEKYEEEKNKINQLNVELEQVIRDREEGEKNMDNVANHREYEILEKQIDEAKNKEDKLRADIKREEKILSELDDLSKEKESLIHSTEKDANETKEGHEKEIASFKAEIEELSEKEKEFSDGLDEEIIIKFQRIIRRNRTGIVAVKGNVCAGCHMILPAQFANEVRDGKKILFCPYCSRILYHENDEAGDQYFSLEGSGNLIGEEDEDDLLNDDDEAGDESSESSSDNSYSMED